MAGPIAAECLNQIFLEARTHNKWQDKPVPDELLVRLVDIMKMGPTSANESPARILFVKTAEAKKRLAPHLSEGNRAKTMSAPVCAIIGYDLRFYDHLPKLFPHTDAKSWFEGKPEKLIETQAFRNGTLQAPISSSRRERWGSTPAPCRASTMRASTASSSPARASSRTFCAASATAIRQAFSEVAALLF